MYVYMARVNRERDIINFTALRAHGIHIKVGELINEIAIFFLIFTMPMR